MSRPGFHRRNAVHDLALVLVLRVHALPVDGFPGHGGRTPRRPRDQHRDRDASRCDHRGLANRHRAGRSSAAYRHSGRFWRSRSTRPRRSLIRSSFRPSSSPASSFRPTLRISPGSSSRRAGIVRTIPFASGPVGRHAQFFGDRVPHDSRQTGSCGSLRRRLLSRPFRPLGLHLLDWLANCGRSQTATQSLLRSLQKTRTRYYASNTSSPPRMPIASPHRRGHRSRKQSAFAP